MNKHLKVDLNGKMTWAYVNFSLVLGMKIGMCNLVILPLGLHSYYRILTDCGFLHPTTSHGNKNMCICIEMYGKFVCFLNYWITKKLNGPFLYF